MSRFLPIRPPHQQYTRSAVQWVVFVLWKVGVLFFISAFILPAFVGVFKQFELLALAIVIAFLCGLERFIDSTALRTTAQPSKIIYWLGQWEWILGVIVFCFFIVEALSTKSLSVSMMTDLLRAAGWLLIGRRDLKDNKYKMVELHVRPVPPEQLN